MDIIESLIKEEPSICRIAGAYDIVLNTECCYTFHTPYTTNDGIVVNLSTFMGTIQNMAMMMKNNDNTNTTVKNQEDQNSNNKLRRRCMFVRIVKKRVAKKSISSKTAAGEQDDGCIEEEKQPTKLGIGVEGGFKSDDDKYETQSTHSVVVLSCGIDDGDDVVPPQIDAEIPYDDDTKSTFPISVSKSVDSVILHVGMNVQQDVKVWQLDADEEVKVSKYANDELPFLDNGVRVSPDSTTWKCQKSGDVDNLWLNLSDGYIGGGRKNWDGSGGSNGALDHYNETGRIYPLVVKLGTITADISTADCYSYAPDEDGPVKIPNLANLLSKRGINVTAMQKTVKSTAELEVELNATYAFDAITESGSELIPVSGPKLQGLQNLGNSCYLNAVVQMLLSGAVIPELAARYGTTPDGNLTQHPVLRSTDSKDATTDLICQTIKLSCALTSGTFARPVVSGSTTGDEGKDDDATKNDNDDDTSTDPKYRLAPRMFKHVIGKNHVDFQTGQQQDSAQFLQYFLEQLDRSERGIVSKYVSATNDDKQAGSILEAFKWKKTGGNSKEEESESQPFYASSHLFGFATETRSECVSDGKVKYRQGAADTVLSLRIPMDKAAVIDQENQKPTTTTTTMSIDPADNDKEDIVTPEQKRLKPADDEKESNNSNDKKEDEEKKPVPTISLQTCLEEWGLDTVVEGIRWPHLSKNRDQQLSPSKQRLRLSNFPRYLLIQMQRYQLGPDWAPMKLEVNVDIPSCRDGDDDLDLSFLRATGQQQGETPVPDDDDDDDGDAADKTKDTGGGSGATQTARPVIDEIALTQLMDMGFSLNSCKRALTAVGGSNVEAAMGWVFEHNTDPDFNDPLPEISMDTETTGGGGGSAGGGDGGSVDEAVVASLVASLGCFTSDQVRAALKETSGSADRAADWLFSHMDDLDSAIAALEAKNSSTAGSGSGSEEGSSKKLSVPPLEDGAGKYRLMGMISHIGKHTGSGHYVAHLKVKLGAEHGNSSRWIILNDEKVAISADPPFAHAYLYLFQRSDTIDTPPNTNY